MLTSLILSSMLMAAPAPADAPPPSPRGAVKDVGAEAPRIVELKPDGDGKVTITVQRLQPAILPGIIIIGPQGQQAPPANPPMVMQPVRVELGGVKDLKVTTVGGKEIKTEDAIKTLAKGGVVIVTSDGKAVDPKFLNLFKGDTLVLVSPELVAGPGGLKGGININNGWIPANPGGRINPRQPAPQLLPEKPKID